MSISIEQRLNDPQVALQLALDATVAGLWTALPGIVQSFNASAVTAKIQPAIQGVVIQPDGTRKAVNLPLLLDVPVVFPRGGGATLTFPVKGGDECLVVFASRCIDAWWQSGGIQLPMEMRKHDLSDGFALIGPQSQAKKIAGISGDSVQLRSDDGSTFIELNPASQIVNIVAPGGVNITAPTVTLSGDLVVDKNATVQQLLTYNGGMQGNNSGGAAATLSGDLHTSGTINADTDVVGAGKSLKSHTHGGIQSGGGNTTAPN